MAVRTVTTSPKISNKNADYLYVRYNDKTANGTEKTFSFPKSLAGIIGRNFIFDDNALSFEEGIGSVLRLDFNDPPAADPGLPPDPETGWADPDHLTAVLPAPPVIPNRGVSPATARKQSAAARAQEFNLPGDFLERLELLARAQRIVSSMIGVNEKPRPQDAQKLVVTAWIDYSRSRGLELSDEDEKMLRNL